MTTAQDPLQPADNFLGWTTGRLGLLQAEMLTGMGCPAPGHLGLEAPPRAASANGAPAGFSCASGETWCGTAQQSLTPISLGWTPLPYPGHCDTLASWNCWRGHTRTGHCAYRRSEY
jgi:hypothetical protein